MERRYSEIACTDTITVKTPKEDAAEDPMNEFGVTGEQMEQIFEYISDHEESNQKIFFDGQIYDAFSLLIGLIQKAETEIVLVDGYVDVGTLNILSKKKENVAVTVYTLQRTKRRKSCCT